MKKYSEEDFGLFKVYSGLNRTCKTIPEREKYYLNVRAMYPDFFTYTDNENPYEIVKTCVERQKEKGDVFRSSEQYQLWFDERKLQKGMIPPLERFFDSGSNIELEEAIQRNIAYSNFRKEYYSDVIGRVVGYEVNIPHVGAKLAGIDLLSIKDDCLYLIELKRCNIFSDSKENEEQLIRALFEISTYYSYVKNAMKHDDALAMAIKKKFNISFTGIKRVVMAPEAVLDDIKFYIESDKKYIRDNFLLLSIKAKKPLANIRVNDCSEELFEISEYEIR